MSKFKFKPNKHEPGCSTNGTRADNAEMALATWRDATGTGADESNVTDMMADLGHLCDREGRDFEAEVETALMNWRAER